MRRTFPFVVFLASAIHVLADGGAVLTREESGNMAITVFADPLPIRVGAVDIGVLVQDLATREPLSEVGVRVSIARSDPSVDTSVWPVVCNSLNGLGTDGVASQANSTNKLLFSAMLGVPSAGDWDLVVAVRRDGVTELVKRPLRIQPAPAPLSAWWPLIAFVPLAIFGYIVRSIFLRQRQSVRVG